MKTTSAVVLACALVDQSRGEQHVLVADADVQGDAKDWWYRAAELDDPLPFDVDGRAGTEKYLEALIEYYDAFIADDRKAIAELDELDVISSNIIQDHVQELEKFQWFMRSHLA